MSKLSHTIIAGQFLINAALLFSVLTMARVTPAQVMEKVKTVEADNKLQYDALDKRLSLIESKIEELLITHKIARIK